jgi:hypothetical protein
MFNGLQMFSSPLSSARLLFSLLASYKFGPYKIDAREVFHATPLSYAMVNLRPLLPGKFRAFVPSSLRLSFGIC